MTLLCLFTAAAFWGRLSEAVIPPTDKVPSVFVREAKQQELFERLIYPARVEAAINAVVLADADGVVIAIRSPLGSRVRSQQAIVSLRNLDPSYNFAAMAVLAPIAGIVGHVDITIGSRVSRGDRLMTITDPSKLRVMIEVASHDLAAFSPGLIGRLMVGDDDVEVKVKGVSPFVDPATGTAACELEPIKMAVRKGAAHGSTYASLTPGTIGRASFQANRRMGFLIPDSAVTYRGKDPFVRLVAAGIATRSPVTLGRKQEGRVEVLRGLKPGDRVVERTSAFVADGEKVTVEEAPADAEATSARKPAARTGS